MLTQIQSLLSRQVEKLRELLEPLRAGTPLVSPAELDALDAEWIKWRSEWVRRRKVFYKCVSRPSGMYPTRRMTGFLRFAFLIQ